MTDEELRCSLEEVGVSTRPAVSRPMIAFGVVLAGLVGLMAAMAWLAYYRALTTEQPLSITACTPGSYVEPEIPEGVLPGVGVPRGPAQEECTRPFAPREDTHVADQPIFVAGQVCNDSDKAISYRVEVAFEPIDIDNVRIVVLDVPITYDPGCQLPYEFPFEVPAILSVGAEPGQSLGDWRIVGKAIPTIPGYDRYVWDGTATVELVAP